MANVVSSLEGIVGAERVEVRSKVEGATVREGQQKEKSRTLLWRFF
jgi:hypothetical protein